MLAQLWLPIVLSGIALFFMSFLAWMIIQLHKDDWIKAPNEDRLMQAVKDCGLKRGKSYMFPGCTSQDEMKSPEFQAKVKAGPRGVITVFDKNEMPQNLLLTLVYYLVVSFGLAYLGSIAFPAGAKTLDVFRFFAAAGLMVFLAAIVPHAVWFKNRITGHVIESVLDGLIVGGIFAAMWPKA